MARRRPAPRPQALHPERAYAAVIGDLVASRRVADRAALQERLETVLREASRSTAAVQAFAPTLGDEFQGVFASLPLALRAALEVRFALGGGVEIRFGIGWGRIPVSRRRRSPFAQDGPAWWAARAALDRVREAEKGIRRPSGWRMGFAAESELPEGPYLEALTIALDALIFRFRDADRTIALGLLRGEPQKSIARRLRVTPSAVAQRASAKGLHSIRELLEVLGAVAA
jgi:hypothetical protein